MLKVKVLLPFGTFDVQFNWLKGRIAYMQIWYGYKWYRKISQVRCKSDI